MDTDNLYEDHLEYENYYDQDEIKQNNVTKTIYDQIELGNWDVSYY